MNADPRTPDPGSDPDEQTLEHALAAAQRSEARFSAIFESGALGAAIVGEDGWLIRVNRPLRKALGGTDEELRAHKLPDFIHPDDGAGAQALFDDLLSGTWNHRHAELRFQIGEARMRWGRVYVSVVRDREGRPFCGLVMVEDVTERKEAEAALRESQHQLMLSHRMEAVGRLAGGIAHDFNNVLTVIGSFAQLLQREVPGGSQAAHYVSEIEKAAARSTSLTRQLLAFSRQQVLKLQRLDLNEVIVEMETMLRRLIQEDILLVTRLEPDLPPVRADEGQVEQVLMNLAVNARDAMPDGGRLLIETAAVELTDADARRYPYQVNPGRYARIRISDSGTGMDADTLERIFEPFFTTKEMGHGSGLGLATVYGIVKQSGGYIWADSTPGGGTTFDVLLPVRLQELPEPGPEAAEPRPTGGSETVLLVEDEPSIRAIASHILTRQGYTVLEATDGTAALHLVDEAEGRIHLLLTDVVMPGMNGRVLAEHLQQRLPDLPVLFMSGYTADALEFYGIERGTSFLDKPFTPDSLSAAVRKVLDREG